MNYLIVFAAVIAGIALGMWLARHKDKEATGLIAGQTERKSENKQKILDFVSEHGKVKNDDVERLAKVSNATAERYLAELEKEGKLIQHGEVGQGVFYTATANNSTR